jgi:hypothetical protein
MRAGQTHAHARTHARIHTHLLAVAVILTFRSDPVVPAGARQRQEWGCYHYVLPDVLPRLCHPNPVVHSLWEQVILIALMADRETSWQQCLFLVSH